MSRRNWSQSVLLSEIKSTATSAFFYVNVVPAGDVDAFLSMADDDAQVELRQRMANSVKPLTPEMVEPLRKIIEDGLRVKLHGRGFVNDQKISFRADQFRIKQHNDNWWWELEARMKRKMPRGYRLDITPIDLDEPWYDEGSVH